jgi:hypothetical protein
MLCRVTVLGIHSRADRANISRSNSAAEAYHLLHDGKIQGRAVITPDS